MGNVNKIVDKAYLERQFKHYHTTVVKPQIATLEANTAAKVDKIQGYGLTKNDFTDELKLKLESLENYDDTQALADVGANADDIEALNGAPTANGSVGKMVNDRIVELVGGSNVTKDTLGKVASWISGHITSAEDMEDAIQENANDISDLQAQQAAAAYEFESEDLDFTTIRPSITVSGDSTVVANETIALISSVYGATWSSSDDTKATVDANGVVTGVAAGEVTITAAKNGYVSGTKTITVTAATPAQQEEPQEP